MRFSGSILYSPPSHWITILYHHEAPQASICDDTKRSHWGLITSFCGWCRNVLVQGHCDYTLDSRELKAKELGGPRLKISKNLIDHLGLAASIVIIEGSLLPIIGNVETIATSLRTSFHGFMFAVAIKLIRASLINPIPRKNYLDWLRQHVRLSCRWHPKYLRGSFYRARRQHYVSPPLGSSLLVFLLSYWTCRLSGLTISQTWVWTKTSSFLALTWQIWYSCRWIYFW